MLYDEGTMGMKVKAPLKSTFSFVVFFFLLDGCGGPEKIQHTSGQLLLE